jgi:hypothetical protein
MFTDGPVTPLHLESLLTFLRAYPKRQFTRGDIKGMFQPPSITDSQDQSNGAVKAAIELKLVVEGDSGVLELSDVAKKSDSVSEALLRSIDVIVLGSTEVEYFFALFYSYCLGLNEAFLGRSREDWAMQFNRDVFENELQNNPFNKDKVTGLHRWFSYVGLGWYDPSGEFNCNPFGRISRNLSQVFAHKRILDSDEFISILSHVCPELDGGKIFLQANRRYEPSVKRCSLGLSHALIDLHYCQKIVLRCPKDSAGWSIAAASPPSDGKTLIGDRISEVEFRCGVSS